MAQIEVIKDDITTLEVDAVVNAANSKLKGGGGVDGAIHRAGGPDIMEGLKKYQETGCPAGQAVVTGAGKMPARMVVHTVGPVWSGGNKNEESLLAAAYRNSLAMADQEGAKTVAFPNISTGVYGFPKKRAAEIAIDSVRRELDKTAIQKVYFVCFDQENLELYKARLANS